AVDEVVQHAHLRGHIDRLLAKRRGILIISSWGCLRQPTPRPASASPTGRAEGPRGAPSASATAGWMISPAATFSPTRSPGARASACSTPCSASAITYGSVAFVSAKVEVIGTAPGMFVTQ